MTKALDLDLKKLKARAYHRAEWAEEVLRRYHSVIPNLNEVDARQLRALYNWMLIPPTVWPFNVQDDPGGLPHCCGKGETPELPSPTPTHRTAA